MKTKLRILAAMVLLLWQATLAFAVSGTVTGGQIDPLPIAIAPFLAASGSEGDAATVAGVIANDLAHSGYFKPLPPESYIEKIADFNANPNFPSWQQVQAKALVTGQVSQGGGKITVAFKLYDVATQQMLVGTSFTAPAKPRSTRSSTLGAEISAMRPTPPCCATA